MDRNAHREVAFAQEGSYHLVHIPRQHQCRHLSAQGEENTGGVLQKATVPKASRSAAPLMPCLCERCAPLRPLRVPGEQGRDANAQHKTHIHADSSVQELSPGAELVTSSCQCSASSPQRLQGHHRQQKPNGTALGEPSLCPHSAKLLPPAAEHANADRPVSEACWTASRARRSQRKAGETELGTPVRRTTRLSTSANPKCCSSKPCDSNLSEFFPPPSPGQMLDVLSPTTTALSSSAAGEDHAWLALFGTREEKPQLQGSPGACASDLCLARKPLELLWCLTDGRQSFAQAEPGIRAGTGNFFFLRAEEENKPSAHQRQPTPRAGITTRGHVHASSRRWQAWKTQRLHPGLSSAASLH